MKRKQQYIFIMLLAVSIAVRVSFFDYQTLDYINFLSKWVEFFREGGGFKALSYSVGNYNIPYLYFIALFSYIGVNDIYLIKILSCIFDYLLAFAGMKLVQKCTKSYISSVICFFVIVFLPTVIINSSLWAQCDSIYVALAFLGIYFALDDRPVLSMVFMSLSFGFKLQSVFILPVCIILLIMKKYRVWHFIIFPVVYLIQILPAVLCGRSLLSAVTLYIDQMDTVGSAANYNSPAFNAITNGEGSVLAAFVAMTLVILFAFFIRRKLNNKIFIILSCIMITVIPFFLPHMHDRYFYAADIMSVILIFAITESKTYEVLLSAISAVFQQFASLICYLAYLKTYYIPLGNIYLTNDRGAVAVLLSLVIYFILLAFELADGRSVNINSVIS